MNNSIKALRVNRTNDETLLSYDALDPSTLPEGEVRVRILWSSLNYKDSLILSGRAALPHYPHVPGIDLVGIVEHSDSPLFTAGDHVIGTGAGLGERFWGGYTPLTRLPAACLVPLPAGLSPRHAMVLGTAGLTAMLAIDLFEQAGRAPHDGEALVTGAGGGVGSLGVMLLANLGWKVVAMEKRAGDASRLRAAGAVEVIEPETLADISPYPMGEPRWAVAIDTVGGSVLAELLRSSRYRGVIAACGMVAGFDVPMNLQPFFARALQLAGIDSVNCTGQIRQRCWARLANLAPRLPLEDMTQEISLADVPDIYSELLEGRVTGRIIVAINP